MSSVSVGSLHAEPSSVRPETTIGRRKAMRSANLLSSLLYGVLIVRFTGLRRLRASTNIGRVVFGPIVESLARLLAQLSFAHQPTQNFRRPKSFRAQLTVQILGN